MPSRLSISPMSQSRRRKIVRWRVFEVKHSQYTLWRRDLARHVDHSLSRRTQLQCAGLRSPRIALPIVLPRRTMKSALDRIGREQLSPQQPVPAFRTSESLQRKLTERKFVSTWQNKAQ